MAADISIMTESASWSKTRLKTQQMQNEQEKEPKSPGELKTVNGLELRRDPQMIVNHLMEGLDRKYAKNDDGTSDILFTERTFEIAKKVMEKTLISFSEWFNKRGDFSTDLHGVFLNKWKEYLRPHLNQLDLDIHSIKSDFIRIQSLKESEYLISLITDRVKYVSYSIKPFIEASDQALKELSHLMKRSTRELYTIIEKIK